VNKWIGILVVIIVVFSTVLTGFTHAITNSDWVTADGEPYMGSIYDSDASLYHNIKTINVGYPDFDLDSNDYPHIVWHEFSEGNKKPDITYAKWDGKNWVKANGDICTRSSGFDKISNDKGSYYSQISLDGSDTPHVTWHSNKEIYYAKWNGSSWGTPDGKPFSSQNNGNISRNGTWSYGPAIDVDSRGNPHIVWSDDNTIRYIKWDGFEWICDNGKKYNSTTNNGRISGIEKDTKAAHPEIVIDSKDNPHIVWYRNFDSNDEVIYVRWDGGKWITADGDKYDPVSNDGNVSKNETLSRYPQLDVDNNNNPHIVWLNHNQKQKYELNYLYWDGNSWVNFKGNEYNEINAEISSSTSGASSPRIAIDGNNVPHITWWSGDEVYYTQLVDGMWVDHRGDKGFSKIKTDSTLIHDPVIALDTYNLPHLVWFESKEIGYIKRKMIFDGEFKLSMDVDTDGDDEFVDKEKDVKAGDILRYRTNLEIVGGNYPMDVGYLMVSVPEGTHYVKDSASSSDTLFYTNNSGSDWFTGEPPDSIGGDIIIKWEPVNHEIISKNGEKAKSEYTFYFSVKVSDQISEADFKIRTRALFKCSNVPSAVFSDLAINKFVVSESESEPEPEPTPEPEPVPEPEPTPTPPEDEADPNPPTGEGPGCDPGLPSVHKLTFKIGEKSYTVTHGNETTAVEMDVATAIIDNRTFLPARYVTEPLSGTISWDGSEKKITCELDNSTIELWINKPTARVNGVEKQIDPDNSEVVPTIIDGRTMVPMRFLAESLGCEVEWVAETKEIILSYSK